VRAIKHVFVLKPYEISGLKQQRTLYEGINKSRNDKSRHGYLICNKGAINRAPTRRNRRKAKGRRRKRRRPGLRNKNIHPHWRASPYGTMVCARILPCNFGIRDEISGL